MSTEQPYAEIQGDNLNIPAPFPGYVLQRAMRGGDDLREAAVVEPYLGYMNAFVVAWLPGSEGRGVREVLFGNYEFTGKLSRTWFRNVGQLPMNVGDKYYNPLFPFGLGKWVSCSNFSSSQLGICLSFWGSS